MHAGSSACGQEKEETQNTLVNAVESRAFQKEECDLSSTNKQIKETKKEIEKKVADASTRGAWCLAQSPNTQTSFENHLIPGFGEAR